MATRSSAVVPALAAAGALVLGLALGGLGPRGEVRELKERVFELERERARGGSPAGRELAELLSGRLGTSDVAPPAPPRSGSPPSDALAGSPPPAREPWGDAGEPTAREATPRPGEEVDPLAAAREAMELRSAQARAALIEDVRPTPEQLHRIDLALTEMNHELAEIARDFVDRIAPGDEPPRRELMSTAAEVLDVLVSAEQRVLDTMSPEQRELVREASTDPTSFVDAGVFEILAELGDVTP